MTTPITTRFVFEVDSAMIQFKMGDIVVTTYTLENNVVTVPALDSPVETDVQSHRSSLQELLTWANFAERHVQTSSNPERPFKLEIEKENSLLDVKFTVETTLLMEASYNKSTGLITWQPHPEAVLNWTDFKKWLSVLSDFSQSIKIFG